MAGVMTLDGETRARSTPCPPRGMRMNSHKHRSVRAAAFAGYRPSTVDSVLRVRTGGRDRAAV